MENKNRRQETQILLTYIKSITTSGENHDFYK